MKSGTSPCPLDQISIIAFQKIPALRSQLLRIIHHCWSHKVLPSCWLTKRAVQKIQVIFVQFHQRQVDYLLLNLLLLQCHQVFGQLPQGKYPPTLILTLTLKPNLNPNQEAILLGVIVRTPDDTAIVTSSEEDNQLLINCLTNGARGLIYQFAQTRFGIKKLV